MKVAVYEVVEVSDEERVAIARHIDGAPDGKRKASSAEMKQFLWEQGSGWQAVVGTGDVSEPDDDLIGDDADPLEDLI
jgi:hypothetical protein